MAGLTDEKNVDSWLGRGERWMVGWIVKKDGWMDGQDFLKDGQTTWMAEWIGK